MSRIRILDEGTAARIAAGEVVERPASIVKELVENAIDAGATAVSVSIENGGLRKITVSDNGFGIEKDDMPMTVLKHATSKIENAKDLERISSMGFRGEALFSIAAVSMFTLRSRTRTAETGCELKVTGGKVESIREAGLPEGTTAIAENLFFNTPARLKFVKSASTETAAVSELMTRFILGNPQISFRYSANDKVIYHSPGSGKVIDAALAIYGKPARTSIAPADFSFNGIRVYGYIGKHTFYQKTSRNQSLFVNGRYIRSEIVRRAVTRAYGERLLKGTYPFYILYIEMPYEEVDVNVHPNKMQVHFRDEGKLEYVVEQAVRMAVENSETTQRLEVSKIPQKTAEIPKNIEKEPAEYTEKPQQPTQTETEPIDDIIRSVFARDVSVRRSEILEQKSFFTDEEENYAFLKKDAIPKKAEETPEPEANMLSEIAEAKYIGAAFNSYLIFEMGEELYLIDQHAAHERMIYDKLSGDERVISQQLLVPEILSFPHDHMIALQENLGILAELGIEAELFGPLSIKVSSVPQIVGEINIRGFFEDILDGLQYGKKNIALSRDRVARAACKRAIKAGQKITEADARKILDEIAKTKVIPHCPHGRPLALAISKTELEKGFKRIV
ncbi:MAG: DNA mismatch repair endonuclease MutL [Christensenellaceae bacterium]|nr:DNA mismatch repair endonuclease MutL [Christensenellaceae bacterium]